MMPVIHTAHLPRSAHSRVIEVPATFVTDRVYVRLETRRGVLTLYTDSGGGSLILTRSAAARLRLPTRPLDDAEAKAELGSDSAATVAPKLSFGLPKLPARAFVVAHASQIPGWPDQADGFVGAKWFGDGLWTWDYAGHRLLYRASVAGTCGQGVPLGFKTDRSGERPTNFARIGVEVEGRELPMLLDTGAETLLTATALAAIGDGGPAFRATSMLEASEFDALRKLHPSWPFVDQAQVGTKAPMLRVPTVTIGNIRTGPVWFTRRSDQAYESFMSSMMDQPVVGSIGGNAFRGLVLTINFGRARAWIQRPLTNCFVGHAGLDSHATAHEPAIAGFPMP